MPITINSILIPADESAIERVELARRGCWKAVVQRGEQLWPGARLTVRDLNGTDMAYTNNIMTETSNATANAWNAMAFGAFTVATSTVLGIYGVRLGYALNATIIEIPITGIRIDVGGSRRVQWNVEKIGAEFGTATAATGVNWMKLGYTPSPVIVSEDMTVTIYEYTKTASTAYTIIWEGYALEKEGITLTP